MHLSRISAIFTSMFVLLFLNSALLSADETVTIGNDNVTRELSWENGHLVTKTITNHLGSAKVGITAKDEFSLTIRPAASNQDVRLSTADFVVRNNILAADGMSVDIELSGSTTPVDLVIRYSTKPGQLWMAKQLFITARESLQIRRVELENLMSTEAYTPYHADQMTSQGPSAWRPPLGQPLYTKTSGTWWGIEFPAARNEVRDGNLVCGYLTKADLQSGETLASYKAVVGVADDAEYVKDAFLEYIDKTRARPLRLQTQYNSWFDYNRDVNADNFAASVRKVNEELILKRGVPPLKVYAIDAGWQDMTRDWTKVGVWPVNEKFDPNFDRSRKEVEQAKSTLGLWVSPGCLFGSQQAIPKMREAGWRTLDPWMSMIGPNYMDALESRLVSLASNGVSYFKLDGIFGHLRNRNFDIDGFQGGEKVLNEANYDEGKERYLSLGSERLMKIFHRMGEANSDVYIVISNGAYLSPWWLQHVDAVWLINVGDHARGNDRTAQLAYRDGAYYQMTAADADHTQFPLNSIFNHEPKKVSSDEDPEVFRRYLFMSLSRGTGFVELYLNTFSLSESDWDVLAEGILWVHRVFPAFKRARMVGGNPLNGEVYGYTGWTENLGYASLHNPSNETREFQITLNRTLGLDKETLKRHHTFLISSPLEEDQPQLPKQASTGETLSIKLPPRAIRVLEFSRTQPNAP